MNDLISIRNQYDGVSVFLSHDVGEDFPFVVRVERDFDSSDIRPDAKQSFVDYGEAKTYFSECVSLEIQAVSGEFE